MKELKIIEVHDEQFPLSALHSHTEIFGLMKNMVNNLLYQQAQLTKEETEKEFEDSASQ